MNDNHGDPEIQKPKFLNVYFIFVLQVGGVHCHGKHVKDAGQCEEVSFLLLSPRSQGLNPGNSGLQLKNVIC